MPRHNGIGQGQRRRRQKKFQENRTRYNSTPNIGGNHLDATPLAVMEAEVPTTSSPQVDSGIDSTSNNTPTTPSTSPTSNPLGWPFTVSPGRLIVESSQERLQKASSSKNGHHLIGRRVITVQAFEWSVQRAMDHGKVCTKNGVLHFAQEIAHGMKSTFRAECLGCKWTFSIETDKDEKKTLDVNEAFVWGTYAAGSHFEASRHLLTALEVAPPDFRNFQRNEDKLADSWETALTKEIEHNGKEERRLALEEGYKAIVDGKEYACTTVAVDGGWSTRSYGHSFKSKGGVGVIIGQFTKKILFLGIRNKYCYFCKRHDKDDVIPSHKCYKNYDSSKSATSMEPDILLEGFNKSIEMHKLIYNKLIGDGDSSVFITLLHSVKYSGIKVQKIECVNHAVKRFNSSLIALSRNTRAYALPHRKELIKEYPRFGKALRASISYNHKTNPNDPNKLRKQIINIPLHIFGEHTGCSDVFCTPERKAQPNRVPDLKYTPMWAGIMEVITRAANIAERLIPNMTSNQAESFMGRASKYNHHKGLHFTGRLGWKTRMMAAALSHCRGSHFYADCIKLTTGASPSITWRLAQRRSAKAAARSRRKVKPRKLNFGIKTPSSQAKKARLDNTGDDDYGSNPWYPDFSDEMLTLGIAELVDRKQIHSKEEQACIEAATIQQALNARWVEERQGRITASNAGPIFSLRDWSNNKCILNKLSQTESLDHLRPIKHGNENEGPAKRAYERQTGRHVQDCGIFVYLEKGIFAASPDGLVGDIGIIEIKCPLSIVGYPPTEMAKHMKSCYLIPKDGMLKLRRTHAYYKQIVMQLHVTQREWCDFVVYSYKIENNIREDYLFIERIHRDETTRQFWDKMKVKFEKFYMQDLAPELVDSRSARCMPYRIPEYREIAIKEYEEKKKQKLSASVQTAKKILKNTKSNSEDLEVVIRTAAKVPKKTFKPNP